MPIKSHEELSEIGSRVLRSAGATDDVADRVARHLVGSNLVGLDSHGIIRLADYATWLQEGKIAGDNRIEVVRDKAATCLIDAHMSFGQVAASQSADIAVQKAQVYGIGLVSVKNASHIGRLGEYVEDIALQGFIGFLCCNAEGAGQLVAPWGGKDARIGTNPMAWGIPSGRESGGMVLDMATSIVPEGKVRVMMRREEEIPHGWVLDSQGQSTTNPADLYGPPVGAILPFGGHKGYGLMLAIEALSGVLSGGGHARPAVADAWFTHGSTFTMMAIEVESFRSLTEFTDDVDEMLSHMKSSPPTTPDAEVLVPYEIESREKAVRLANGITIEDSTWDKVVQVASGLGISI